MPNSDGNGSGGGGGGGGEDGGASDGGSGPGFGRYINFNNEQEKQHRIEAARTKGIFFLKN